MVDILNEFVPDVQVNSVTDNIEDDYYAEVMRKYAIDTGTKVQNVNVVNVIDDATQQIMDVAQGLIDTDVNNNIVQFEDVIETKPVDMSEVCTHKYSTEVSYPCLWLRAKNLPTYKATVLNALLSAKVFEKDVLVYPVYLELNDTVMLIGYIDSCLLKEVLEKKVFEIFEKSIKLTPDQELKGEMMYAMCSCVQM